MFTTGFHPNEEVAVEMAKLVAEKLRKEGRRVEVIDLGKRKNWARELSQNDMSRAKLLLEVMGKHNGEFFDFHDSPVEGLQQRYQTEEPTIELTRGGYYLVETPAVYVSQENREISSLAGGERELINRYFERRSDVNLSREADYLSEANIEILAGKIREVVERREKAVSS